MNVVENTPARLVIGGWKVKSILTGTLFAAMPVAFYLTFVQEEPMAIWANLFILLVVLGLVPRMVLWERIEFDLAAEEARFDQLRPIGRLRRTAPLTPVSRVEIETSSSASNNKPSRRLTLVNGRARTPFTKLFSSGRLDDDQGILNDWLKEAFGDRWRDAATRMAEGAGSATDADLPDGVTRIRHPRTGLTIDVPTDWAASVSLERTGPLRIFGVTLLPEVTRTGEPRAPGDGADWNRLLVTGADDAGLTIRVHDGPLQHTLDSMLNGPWAMRWGVEVLKTTPEVELGGMTGFSVARRIPKGGFTPLFGEVGADVATRQVWLGADHLHVEIVGMARLDHPEMQSALDAMFGSVKRSPEDAGASQV